MDKLYILHLVPFLMRNEEVQSDLLSSLSTSLVVSDSPPCKHGSFGLNATGILVFLPYMCHVWSKKRCLPGCTQYLFFPRDTLHSWNGSRMCCLGVFGRRPGSPPLPPPVSVTGCLSRSHKGCQVTVWHTTHTFTQNSVPRLEFLIHDGEKTT